ncbi:AzlD family protein [Desulfomarina sp.]
MDNSRAVYLAIFAAALVTYLLRASGLILADYFPKKGRFKKFMDALPGTILLSLIVPAALSSGWSGWLATVCTALCSLRTGNVFVSMVLGVVLVAVGRWWQG